MSGSSSQAQLHLGRGHPSARAIDQRHLAVDGSTTLSRADFERRVEDFDTRRPWRKNMHQSRITSWADPFSAQDSADDEADSSVPSRTKQLKEKSRLGTDSVLAESERSLATQDDGGFSGTQGRYRKQPASPTRRRSFHDLVSFQEARVLPMERMRIDVELSAQMLIMWRRERHMEDLLACLQHACASLASTDISLREDYEKHRHFLVEIEARAHVITQIEEMQSENHRRAQEASSLRYESQQYDTEELWSAVHPKRQKVLSMRDKVFGTGGRRLPNGVHGAHDRFNRLQWTLDGEERLVDWLGRTESEAEEEGLVKDIPVPEEEQVVEVIENVRIKPMWLLNFFGRAWGDKQEDGKEKSKKSEETPGKPSPLTTTQDE